MKNLQRMETTLLIVYVCACVLNVRYVLKMERTVVG